jgi:hypothetical protein
MAISANDIIQKYGSEAQLTVTTPGAVNAGGFSASSDINIWANADDVPFAVFKLKLTAAGLSGAPTAGDTINLYARPMNTEGTEDSPTPDANNKNHYLGQFKVDAADADQVINAGPFSLPNYQTGQQFEFFIENDLTSVNIASDGWDLWITPSSFGLRP